MMPPEGDSPFPGPRPYNEDETSFFVGREPDLVELLALVRSHRRVLIYGRSGVGKSSLVNAGLVPQLQNLGRVLPVVRCHELSGPDAPGISSARSLLQSLVNTVKSDHGLSDAVTREAPNGGYDNVILVFDQLEALFLAEGGSRSECESFFMELEDALDSTRELRVVYVLREDFLGELDSFSELIDDRLRWRRRLAPLTTQAARTAILLPLLRVGTRVQEAAAEALVRQLTERRKSGGAKVLKDYVEPLELQIACDRLWREWCQRPSADEELTAAWVDTRDWVTEGLRDFYQAVLVDAMGAFGVPERRLRHWFEQHLLTPTGSRGLLRRGEQQTGGLPNAVIDLLERGRLIRSSNRDGDTWYELAHDRFVDVVREANREWFADRVSQYVLDYQPVQASPDWSSELSGTAACFAGRGHRSIMFGVGSAWRLWDAGVLQGVDLLSGASAGSAVVGRICLKWPELLRRTMAPGDDGFRSLVAKPLMDLAGKDLESLRGAMTRKDLFFGEESFAEVFGEAVLCDLPSTPRLSIGCSNLQTGDLWEFTQVDMGSSSVGRTRSNITLGQAVAASTTLWPLRLNLSEASFASQDPHCGERLGPEFRETVLLTDGSIVDRPALHAAWERYLRILICDGSDGVGLVEDRAQQGPVGLGQIAIVISFLRSLRRRRAYWGDLGRQRGMRLPQSKRPPPASRSSGAIPPSWESSSRQYGNSSC